jgi:ABC-type multidrug transport system, permease component
MLPYLRLEIVRMASDRRFLILMLAMPVAMYLLFTNLFGAANNQPTNGLTPAVGVMISMAAFGAIGAALTATGPRIAQERTNGWMRQLRIMPLSARSVISAKVLAALVWALPAILLVLLTAVLDHGVSLTAGQWIAIGGLLWVGTAPFAALGILIGYVTDDSSAFPVMYGIYLFLGAVGGLWMPPSVLPSALRHISYALPSNRVAEFGWRIAAGHSLSLAGPAILLAWLIAFSSLAALAYRRTATR